MENYEFRKVQGLMGDISFCVVLPKHYASDMQLKKGDYLKVTLDKQRLIFEKA